MINLEDQITQNLEELNTLKNDKYFSKEDINKVSDFETSFDNALNEKDLDTLKTVSEDTSEFLETSREKIKNYEKQYSELRNQVFKSEELLKSVYSKDADVKTLNQVLTTSNQALEEDDYTEYSDLIDKLSYQNETLSKYIKKKSDENYSDPLYGGSEYPFAVSEAKLDEDKCWMFDSLVKHSSNNPSFIVKQEQTYTDKKENFSFSVGDEGVGCSYEIKNVPTKEINVETAKGKIEKAFVNTEIQFKVLYNGNYATQLEKPAYLFVDKKGIVNLAIKNFDGEDYYMLYPMEVY